MARAAGRQHHATGSADSERDFAAWRHDFTDFSDEPDLDESDFESDEPDFESDEELPESDEPESDFVPDDLDPLEERLSVR